MKPSEQEEKLISTCCRTLLGGLTDVGQESGGAARRASKNLLEGGTHGATLPPQSCRPAEAGEGSGPRRSTQPTWEPLSAR